MLFVYVGTEPRDFPGDGVRPSFSVEVGDTVEAETNPDPHWFDPETTGVKEESS